MPPDLLDPLMERLSDAIMGFQYSCPGPRQIEGV